MSDTTPFALDVTSPATSRAATPKANSPPPRPRKPVSSDDPQPRPGPPKQLVIPPPHESVLRYANTRKKKKVDRNVWWRFLLRVLFSHLGLLILVSLYCAVGALLFIKIEEPHEHELYKLKRIRALEVNDTINYMSSLFWFYQDLNLTSKQWAAKIYKDMKQFEDYVIESVDQYHYDGTIEGWNTVWSFPSTLLFTISTVTTIGYGHIAPQTQLGQLFCILYSIIGLPLTLVFLANIGDAMADAFIYSYSRLCCHWCRVRRRKSEYRKGDDSVLVPREYLRLNNEKIGDESYMPTDTIAVPILLSLLLLVFYITLGAIFFAKSEKWDLLSAAYFTFITLTTIGFGDLVPGKHFIDNDDEGSLSQTFNMIVTSGYCAVGLALVSMCISLMQEQLLRKVKGIAVNIGLVKPEPPPMTNKHDRQ